MPLVVALPAYGGDSHDLTCEADAAATSTITTIKMVRCVDARGWKK